jgi:hypothetical protein
MVEAQTFWVGSVLLIGLLLACGRTSATVHITSTPAGREGRAAEAWSQGDAVVLITAQPYDAAGQANAVTVKEVFKGSLQPAEELMLTADGFPTKPGRSVAGVLPLDAGRDYILFLRRKDTRWIVPTGSLLDGTIEGPDLTGIRGFTVKVDQDLGRETARTVAALRALDAPTETDRFAGLLALSRGPGPIRQEAFRRIEKLQAPPVMLRHMVESDGWEWDTARLARQLQVLDQLAGLRPGTQHSPFRGMAEGDVVSIWVRIVSRDPAAKRNAIQEFVSILKNRGCNQDRIAELADPDVDRAMEVLLSEEVGGKRSLRGAAEPIHYFWLRKDVDPRRLSLFIASLADRSIWDFARRQAMDVMARTTQRSLRTADLDRMNFAELQSSLDEEAKRWQEWWQREGSKDPRYRR